MKVVVAVICLAVAAFSGCTATLPPYCAAKVVEYPKAEGTLRQVHLAIRHGDRIQVNASQCWKDDKAVWDCLLTEAVTPTINRAQPYLRVERLYRKVFDTGREELPGNCALGQLTAIGFKQQITNGENYRKIYVDSGFLSTNFTTNEVYVRSDDIYRTMQSAQMFMTGMYPPSQPVEGRPGIMDINTMDPSFEDIYPNPLLCPKVTQYIKEYFKSPQFLQHYTTVGEPLLKDLQTALDNDKFKYEDIFQLFDCLNVHLCHQVATPSTITTELYQRVMKEVTYVVNNMYSYPTTKAATKVGIGFFLKEMYKEVERMIIKKSKRRFLLYSGHDVTLMTMLLAFGIDDGVWTPYASQLIFEIYEMSSGSFAMRILYNGKEMPLPWCDYKVMCDTNTVKKYIQAFLPGDRKTECF